VVVGGAIIGGATAAAYDVFVNQGFGGENLFRRNLSEVDWERARRVEAIGAGIGAATAASALFALSQISGLIAASVQHGVYSLGFTQAAHAAMWNIGGTLVMDSLAYHGLSEYVETGRVDVGALLREESHNPLLAGMFLADFGFGAYEQFQAHGGLLALRARWKGVTTHRVLGARGPYYRPISEPVAGGPVRKLSLERVRITPKGVDVVERHLKRFANPLKEAENAMLQRLREISLGRQLPEGADLRFYTHELREFVRYRRVGYPISQPSDPDLAYELWANAHAATLADYGLPEMDSLGNHTLYHLSLEHLLR